MPPFSPELKKGSTELLVLSLVEERARHGYEIGKLIEARTKGRLTFSIPALYPTLCRLYYRLTPKGRRVLAERRENWRAFAAAVEMVLGVDHA